MNNRPLLDRLIAKKDLDLVIKKEIEERIAALEDLQDVLSLRESHLQDWYDDQSIYNLIDQNETKCGMLGDSIYHIYWDEEEKCPRLKTFDPGMCFPSKYPEDDLDGSWGDKEDKSVLERFVVAWEEEYGSDEYFRLYREVYELRIVGGDKKCFRHKAYYKYAGDSHTTFANIGDDLLFEDYADAEWEDIDLDYIPFVWIPNHPVEGEEPYGKSNIHSFIQLLDNMMNSYTDLNINSEYLGGVILGLSGEEVRPKTGTDGTPLAICVQPRSAYYLGKDGRISVVDVSGMQKALLETIDAQEKKFLRNANIPDIIVGREQSAPSGVALKILMQPLLDKINPMRKSRVEFYAILFYYIQRMYQDFGSPYEKKLFEGTLYDVRLQFGGLIPEDQVATDQHLLQMKSLVSQQTLLEEMKAKGYNINVDTELARLQDEKAKQEAASRAMFSNQYGVGGSV
jgi:hypothetical protein